MQTSHWEQTTYYQQTDIVIAGAGFMGLWSAWEIRQKYPHLSITIVDKNPTPLGASTRNAGFACFGSLTELISDEATIGTDAMLAIVEMRFRGIEKIKQLFSKEEIDYDACGGYETLMAAHPAHNQLPEKIDYFNELLSPFTETNAFVLATSHLSALGLKNFDALIFNRCEAGIHSGKLVYALTKKLIAKGVTIIFGNGIESYQATHQGVEVLLHNKAAIKTDKLLLATNAFTNALTGKHLITPGRGQILLSSPIPDVKTIGTFHYDEGFYYWRNIGNRILIGGGRNADFEAEETTDLNGSDTIRNILSQFLQHHFNYPITIEQSWSGIMGFTKNKKPIFQQIENNVYAATACNGMGVALSPVWAEHVAKHIL
jgi:glycine/D-amino acid oxidase-like deaminating enzyme